jgi:hypothetical protein
MYEVATGAMRRTRMRTLEIVFWSLLFGFALCALQPCAAADSVSLTVESLQDVYVLREPVLLTGHLTNGSPQPIRIYGINTFGDQNMECLFLEIITPDGRKQERRSHFGFYILGKSDGYKGEPLNPGETFTFDVFPNILYSIYSLKEDAGLGFPTPGEYKIKLVYEVEQFRAKLWKPPGNRLYSNQISIRVVAPTEAQREILGAYWSNVVTRWEGDEGMTGFDADRLKDVLTKYPNDPFIKYVHYALLWLDLHGLDEVYKGPKRPIDLADAQLHAAALMERYPNFRPGRVRWAYASVLIKCDRKAEGLRLLDEALRLEPHLKDDYGVMHLKVITERGRNADWPWVIRRNTDRSNEGPTPKKE